jgi:hypothetical protein
MPNLLSFGWLASKPIRLIYNILSIISIVFTALSLIYYGFFDHRVWITQRVAEQYQQVEKKQISVASLLIATVPSRSNGDTPPTAEQILLLQEQLLQLSGTVTQVDAVSDAMIEVSNRYRGSISELASALIRYDPEDSFTHGELFQAVDRWDVAAREYSDVVESHIGSFSRTLPSSI